MTTNEVLAQLQDKLKPVGGSVTITTQLVSADPFLTFAGGLPQSQLVMVNVPASGGEISNNPDGSQTLTLQGGLQGGWAIPGLQASLTNVVLEFSATAQAGASTLASATLKIIAATLSSDGDAAAPLPSALQVSGELVSDPVVQMSLAATEPSGEATINAVAASVTAGIDTAVIPQLVQDLNPDLFKSLPLNAAQLSFSFSANSYTSLSLSLSLGSAIDVLGLSQFAIDAASVTVTGGLLVPSPTAAASGCNIFCSLSGTFSLQVSGTTEKLACTLDMGGRPWRLRLAPSNADAKDAIEALASLVGAQGDVDKVFQQIGLDSLSLKDIAVKFDPTRSPYFIGVDVDIGCTWCGANFVAEFSLPAMSVSLLMPDNPDNPSYQPNVLSAQKVVAQVTGDLIDFSFPADVYLDALSLYWAPLSSTYSLGFSISSNARLSIDGVEMTLGSIEFAANFSPSNRSCSLSGSGTVGGAGNTLAVDAMVSYQSQGGWNLQLMCTDSTPTEFNGLLSALGSVLGLSAEIPSVPKIPLTFTMNQVSFGYDTADKSVSADVDVSASLSLLGKGIAVDGNVSFTSAYDAATDKRGYDFAIAMPWTIDGTTLALEFTFDDTSSIEDILLIAYWLDQSGSLKPDSLFDAVGFTVPSGVESMLGTLNLGLKGVYFSYDFVKENLTLAAETTSGNGGDAAQEYALLQLGKQLDPSAPKGNVEIILGVGLQAASKGGITLADLPLIGDIPHVADFDFIGLESACIMATSIGGGIANYQPPALPFFPDGDNPFAALTSTAQSLQGGFDLQSGNSASDVAVIAVAVFTLQNLVSNPGTFQQEMGLFGQLVGDAVTDVKPELFLLGGFTLGSNPSVSVEVDLKLDLGLQVSVNGGQKASFMLEGAALEFTYSEQYSALLNMNGSIQFTLPMQGLSPVQCTGGIALNPSEVEGYFNCNFPGGQKLPGLNAWLLDVGAELGVTFGDDVGVDIGLIAELAVGAPSGPNSDVCEVAFVVSLDYAGEAVVPNLNALCVSIDTFSFDELWQLIDVNPSGFASSGLNDFSINDFYFAWSEPGESGAGNILPDGTNMPAGMSFATQIAIASCFEGWFSGAIGTQGGFSIDAQCSPLGWNGVSVTGNGSAISKYTQTVHVNGVAHTVPTISQSQPACYQSNSPIVLVEQGGPTFIIRTTESPYIDMSFSVDLAGLGPVAATKIVVSNSEVTFSIDVGMPDPFNSTVTFDCTLGSGGFGASGQASFGPDIDLVAVKDISVTATFTFSINGSDFSLGISLGISFEYFDLYKYKSASISASTPTITVPDEINNLKNIIEDAVKEAIENWL